MNLKNIRKSSLNNKANRIVLLLLLVSKIAIAMDSQNLDVSSIVNKNSNFEPTELRGDLELTESDFYLMGFLTKECRLQNAQYYGIEIPKHELCVPTTVFIQDPKEDKKFINLCAKKIPFDIAKRTVIKFNDCPLTLNEAEIKFNGCPLTSNENSKLKRQLNLIHSDKKLPPLFLPVDYLYDKEEVNVMLGGIYKAKLAFSDHQLLHDTIIKTDGRSPNVFEVIKPKHIQKFNDFLNRLRRDWPYDEYEETFRTIGKLENDKKISLIPELKIARDEKDEELSALYDRKSLLANEQAISAIDDQIEDLLNQSLTENLALEVIRPLCLLEKNKAIGVFETDCAINRNIKVCSKQSIENVQNKTNSPSILTYVRQREIGKRK